MRCLSIVIVLIASIPVAANSSAAETNRRTWTSRDGQYKVQAELVRYDGEIVQLRKSDGTIVKVPVAKLSRADGEYLKTHGGTSQTNKSLKSKEVSAAKSVLAGHGIRVNSLGPALNEEAEFTKAIRAILDGRKQLLDAATSLAQANQREAQIKQQLIRLISLHARLTAQLAALNPGDVATNNRLVGAISSNQSQTQLAGIALSQHEKMLQSVRSQANQVRENYVQSILDARKVADRIGQEYQDLAADTEVSAAVARLNKALDKSYQLVPSRTFQRNIARLTSLESEILTEAIPLQGSGRTLLVSAVINGKHAKSMVVDSGADLVTLPHAVAVECGIKIPADAPRLKLSVADGRTISGRLVSVKSIRVGQFAVENVDCVVLGPEATNAPTLLGMSFLTSFQFKIDTDGRTLTLVRVKAEPPPSRHH